MVGALASCGIVRTTRRAALASLAAPLVLAAAPWAQAATSPVAWSTEIGAPVYNAPRASAGHVYLTSAQSKGDNVFALDVSTGRLMWKYGTGGAIPMPPSVGATQVFVASDIGDTHYMRALDARTGTPVWEYTRSQPPQCMCSHPATSGLPPGRDFTRERGQAEEHLEGGHRHGDRPPAYADGVLAAFRWLHGQTTQPPAR